MEPGAVPQAQSDVPLDATRRPVGTELCPLGTARRRYFRASGSNDRARRCQGDRVPSLYVRVPGKGHDSRKLFMHAPGHSPPSAAHHVCQ